MAWICCGKKSRDNGSQLLRMHHISNRRHVQRIAGCYCVTQPQQTDDGMGIVVMLSGRTGIEIDFNFSSPGRLLPVLVLIVPALGTENSGATYYVCCCLYVAVEDISVVPHRPVGATVRMPINSTLQFYNIITTANPRRTYWVGQRCRVAHAPSLAGATATQHIEGLRTPLDMTRKKA